jgi:hypothetical protein
VKLVINGKEVSTDVSPQIIDGRTMVPNRVISESLGAKVQYDETTKTVTVVKESGDTVSTGNENDQSYLVGVGEMSMWKDSILFIGRTI